MEIKRFMLEARALILDFAFLREMPEIKFMVHTLQ